MVVLRVALALNKVKMLNDQLTFTRMEEREQKLIANVFSDCSCRVPGFGMLG